MPIRDRGRALVGRTQVERTTPNLHGGRKHSVPPRGSFLRLPDQKAILSAKANGFPENLFRSFTKTPRPPHRFLNQRASAEETNLAVRPIGLRIDRSRLRALFFSAVPIVIDPGMGLKSLLRCICSTRPSHMVGIPPRPLGQSVLSQILPKRPQPNPRRPKYILLFSARKPPRRRTLPVESLRMNSSPLSLLSGSTDRPKVYT